MCLAQGPQRSDTGEARTRSLSVSSQALYHCALYVIAQCDSQVFAAVCGLQNLVDNGCARVYVLLITLFFVACILTTVHFSGWKNICHSLSHLRAVKSFCK